MNLIFGSLMVHKQNELWFKPVRKWLIALNLGKELYMEKKKLKFKEKY